MVTRMKSLLIRVIRGHFFHSLLFKPPFCAISFHGWCSLLNQTGNGTLWAK